MLLTSTRVASAEILHDALRSCQRFWPSPELVLDERDERHWMPCRRLSEDAQVDDLLAYQRSFTPDLDRKGQAAYAIGDVSHMLATAVVPLFVGFRMVPSLSLSALRIGFDTRSIKHRDGSAMERLWRIRFGLADLETDDGGLADKLGIEATPDLAGVLRRSIEMLLAPLVQALHRRSGLSRNALWRLVTDSFSQLFLDAGRRFGRVEKAKADAMLVLKAPGSPLANRQMHFFDIEICSSEKPGRILASVAFRARGGCCRYYTVEGGHLCATCVLQNPAERDAKLRQYLRGRFGQAQTAAAAIDNPTA